MPKSVFTGAYKHLVQVLVGARKEAGMTQAQLAAAVGKDQSFVSIIEGSQRRVDVLEFVALAKAMRMSPVELFAKVVGSLPDELTI
jgi:transcriptional regulator with XRE-family HTH domain